MLPRRNLLRSATSLALLCSLPVLNGCGGFFYKETGGNSGGGTTGSSYAFVGNAGANSVGVFALSSTGQLTAVSGSPFSIPQVPTSLAVSKANNFLYVGTPAGIYGYSIGTGGGLSSIASGSLLAISPVSAMQVSPDGQWLIMLSGDGITIQVYAINATTGVLTQNANINYTTNGGTPVPRDLRISPNGLFVYAALGTGGTLVFQFTTTNGSLNQSAILAPQATSSDNGIAIDKNSAYLYIVRSGVNQGMTVYAINGDGSLSSKGSAYATGSQPYSVAVDATASYAYVANRSDSTISGYNIATPTSVTSIAGSPFSSGLNVTGLTPDSSGKWLLAASYGGSPDLTAYGFDAANPGRIYAVSSAASGTNASFIAVTH